METPEILVGISGWQGLFRTKKSWNSLC